MTRNVSRCALSNLRARASITDELPTGRAFLNNTKLEKEHAVFAKKTERISAPASDEIGGGQAEGQSRWTCHVHLLLVDMIVLNQVVFL